LVTKQIGKFSLKVATLTLLAGGMIFAGATHAIAQETSPSLANEIAQERSPSIA
jgi:plastocyanin